MKKAAKKANLNRSVWIAVGLTALFLIAAVVIALRPRTELTLSPARNPVEISVELIDLNEADSETLQTLPGIGPELARRILDYRAAQGGFQSVSELTNIDGIGEKTYAELLPYLTVSVEEEP